MTTAQDPTTRVANLEATIGRLSNLLTSQAQRNSISSNSGVDYRHHMYKEAIVFQDIFNAYNSNVFTKKGSPGSWDETSYATNPWNGRRILRIGNGVQSNGNGILVDIPTGYNVLWLRVLGDRWTTFRVSPQDATSPANFQDWTEVYAAGFRNLNKIAPDGAGTDSQWNVHEWVPIPLRATGTYMVYSAQNSDAWLSGIGYGKNIWNHAVNAAVAFLWQLNPGTGNIGWVGENWNSDQLAYFPAGSNVEVSVPVIFTGKDKLIYIVEHNNNWQGNQHGNVFINGQQVERFRTTFQNPFAVHNNGKLFNRYIATVVPASLIQSTDKFVRLRIDMTGTNNHIHFREIGTHDHICCTDAPMFGTHYFTVRGVIKSAVTGLPLTDDVLQAAHCVVTLTSVVTGKVYTATISGGIWSATVPQGKYTVKITMDGYVTNTFVVDVQSNIDESTGAGQILVSPTFTGWRFILTWGPTPLDLDAHLKTPDGDEIFWSNRTPANGKAWLDTDCRTGFGPETITIGNPSQGVYRYFVKNYSNEVPIFQSKAKVQVLKDGNLWRTFTVPINGSTEVNWNVIQINTVDGSYNIVNALQNDDPQ